MKPKTFEEALELSRKPEELRALVRARLVELVFTQDASVAVRAAEMVLSMGLEQTSRPLADIPTATLFTLRERVREWVRREASADGGLRDQP